MEQHGVRAYLSFSKTPTFVGTGELVLLHVSGRWTLSTMVSIGLDLILLLLVFRYQLFPSFRRGGLLLSSSFLPLAEETVDPSWTPFLLAVKISDRRCFWESPTSPPSSDMDAASFIISSILGWSSRASWSSRTSEWFGLPRSRDFPCAAWTFHDAGFVC